MLTFRGEESVLTIKCIMVTFYDDRDVMS